MSYIPVDKEVFHIHTYRCKHASDEKDFEYIDAAIRLGAKRIVFTDHVPFPGNPFKNRMLYEELPGYISSINQLKDEYKDRIEVLCGLEIEYLPSYHDYFCELKKTEGMDLLIIGQHFYEHGPGHFSYADLDKTYEFEGQCHAMAEGIRTGLFDVVGHPDRSFRASDKMGEREKAAAMEIMDALLEDLEHAPCLEKNYSSKIRGIFFKQEFWDMVPDGVRVIFGLDAHSVTELENGYQYKW